MAWLPLSRGGNWLRKVEGIALPSSTQVTDSQTPAEMHVQSWRGFWGTYANEERGALGEQLYKLVQSPPAPVRRHFSLSPGHHERKSVQSPSALTTQPLLMACSM